MGTVQDLRMKNPAHPSRFVTGEIVTAMGLSVTGDAAALGGARPSASARSTSA